MESIVSSAINKTYESEVAYCKFIVPNEVGMTGSHQVGFYVAKTAYQVLFDEPGEKGENKDKFVRITWQDDFDTDSRFIYYGRGTRNEYRITRFGRGFPFLTFDNLGDLFVLLKIGEDVYRGYVFSNEEDIDDYLAAFGLSPVDTNKIIDVDIEVDPENELIACYNEFIEQLTVDFPTTKIVADQSRNCYNNAFDISDERVIGDPDRIIIKWLESEFELFKALEKSRYSKYLASPFDSIENLVSVANTILNRRKSRAGASLEHHLENIFSILELEYSAQATTEGKKKPDFIFPSEKSYHDPRFDQSGLVMLAAKTTCKDRWRQILNEANRIEVKHLFTLQQGISENQLDEMVNERVQLVVPREYVSTFPPKHRENILTLNSFIQIVK
ncbi:restriction endonuclease [Lewinellaceae bacterium SD302]|nr:restriction endonuclease [Lewinellaceae bacterium SD302]